MAKIYIKGLDEYALKLDRMAADIPQVAKKAIYQATKVVADEIKNNLEALPEDEFRFLKSNETFSGVPKEQKQDLIDSFGVTSIEQDNKGDWNAKIGFDGYGKFKTKKYPKGVPNPLLARAIESGSSVRKKTPFVRPAINATKGKAIDEMTKVIDEEYKKTFK